MVVTVNGSPMDLPADARVDELLAKLGLERAVCAVEVNRTLVPHRRHQETVLRPDDRVEIVTLVGGG